jgi:hypothetical protein
MRSARSVEREDWVAPPSTSDDRALDAGTRAALADAWLRDALEEHASVAAFARLTMHLLSLGAPPDLVAESQRASLDEIRHAKIAFASARRYGGAALGPGRLALDGAVEPVDLVELVRLTAAEGCVGETLGAALAEEQAHVATDPEAKRILRRIARDEARHAALAWKIVGWAVGEDGRDVKRALRAAVERTIEETLAAPSRVYDAVSPALFHAHGRLFCDESREVVATASRAIVVPCLDRLAPPEASVARLTPT